jgi:putative FmdB family regulatory protein
MPLYDYQCTDCGRQDQRIGALDDYTALCVDCGGLMLRLDDPFDPAIPLWDEKVPPCAKS